MAAERISTPCVTVTVNGIQAEGLLQAHILSTNTFSADTFSLTFATGKPPLLSTSDWTSIDQAYLEVNTASLAGMPGTLLISGFVDTMNVDPMAGSVSVEGRDLSASLIDGYRQQDFMNQTASEIVTAIARSRGLVPVVAATRPIVGRYYSSDYTQLSLAQYSRFRSDWDLIVQLARENEFDVFVSGSELYFQPSAAVTPAPYLVSLGDVTSLRLQRMLLLPDSPVVKVQSWNSQTMAGYSSSDGGGDSGLGTGTAAADGNVYLFCEPNLTGQQVSQAGQRYVAEVTRLRTVLSIGMPWNFDISPRSILSLDLPAKGIVGRFRVESVDRHYNTITGSSQHVRASLIQP